MRKFWSEDEIKLLINLYENMGLSLSELMPIFNEQYNRSADAIKLKIIKCGLKHSKEQIKKIKSRLNSGSGNGMYNKISPTRGLNKETSEMIKLRGEKISKKMKELHKSGLLRDFSGINNPMYGKEAWNKGENKYTNVKIFNAAIKTSKGKKKWWLSLPESEKYVIVNRLNKAMIQNNKITKIEEIIASFLNSEGYEFIQNKQIGRFFVDFYLPKNNLVIECDGDYWHGNPEFFKESDLNHIQLKNIDRDKRKNEMLFNKNIKIIRFWEHDIKYRFDKIKESICVEQLVK